MNTRNRPHELQRFFDEKNKLLVKRKKLQISIKNAKRNLPIFAFLAVIGFVVDVSVLLTVASMFIGIPVALYSAISLPLSSAKLTVVTNKLKALGVDYKNTFVQLSNERPHDPYFLYYPHSNHNFFDGDDEGDEHRNFGDFDGWDNDDSPDFDNAVDDNSWDSDDGFDGGDDGGDD